VSVGDETGAQTVGAVACSVDPGTGYGLLDQLVDRLPVEPSRPGNVSLGDPSEDVAIFDRRQRPPGVQRLHRAALRIARSRQDDKLGVIARLIGLGAGDREHQAVGVFVHLSRRHRGKLRVPQRGHESDEQERSVPLVS
jgi:hypothetical protein